MAGRNPLLPHILSGRASLEGPVALRAVHGGGALIGAAVDVLPPSVALLEQKIASQHTEIQRLLSENQRLATTHIALRQELAATQQEIQRVQQALAILQNEKEQQMRSLAEKAAKLEADLLAVEPLKVDLENTKAGAHKLLSLRQDLSNQITLLTQELHRARTDLQQVPTMTTELEGLRQEIQRARTAFELEKKVNTEFLEQRGAMEKNLVSMAREVEKLRAKVTNAEKRSGVGSYGEAFGAPDPGYASVASYGDLYDLSQMSVAAEKGVPFGSGSAAAWGAYDWQRASGALLRR